MYVMCDEKKVKKSVTNGETAPMSKTYQRLDNGVNLRAIRLHVFSVVQEIVDYAVINICDFRQVKSSLPFVQKVDLQLAPSKVHELQRVCLRQPTTTLND